MDHARDLSTPHDAHHSPHSGAELSRRRALLLTGAGLTTLGVGGAFVGQRTAHATAPGAPEWVPAHRGNYTAAQRPSQYSIRYVVVHTTETPYATALRMFQSSASEVSAHYVIRSRDGHVAQTVRERDVAWHAGNWEYNARSIGIEHEGTVAHPERWFTSAMYTASAKLTAAVCRRYDIPVDRQHIIGHHEVPGADHTDPGGGWDWDRFLRLVRQG